MHLGAFRRAGLQPTRDLAGRIATFPKEGRLDRAHIDLLRCPACGDPLRIDSNNAGPTVESGRLACPCGRTFDIANGVPNLVHPADQRYLNEPAETYDRDIAFIMRLLGADEDEARRSLVDLLDLGPGARVLEVACGPGPNLPHLADRLGPDGRVWALDISPDMIRVARARLPGDRVAFVLGNGCHLPFVDATFDAVLHVGTLNRFDDVPGALAEMARVVRPGGKVVAADEGVAPWLESTDFGRTLARFGTLFQGAPPLAAVPARARDVTLRWLPGYAFFVIDFRVESAPPQLNLDVTLPGRDVTVRDVLDAGTGAGARAADSRPPDSR